VSYLFCAYLCGVGAGSRGDGVTNHRVPPFIGKEVDAESLEDFCLRYYKPDRYMGRGQDYATAVLKSQRRDMGIFGFALINRHESITGKNVVWRGRAQ
jgi:hypothetical protein